MRIAVIALGLALMSSTALAQQITTPPPAGGAPTGAAGGDLGGTYPNPSVVSVADVTTGVLAPANGGSGVANTGNLIWNAAQTLSFTSGQTMTFPAASTTLAGLGTAQTFSAANIFSAAGAASTPGLSITGAPYTGGSTTTNTPQLYINSGAVPTTWPAAGTMFGINTPSGFTGSFLDFHTNGGVTKFNVDSNGSLTVGSSVTLPSTGLFFWSGGAILSNAGSGKLQLGLADGATASAQSLYAQSIVAGTSNTGGGGLTLRGPLSTGSGTPGDIVLQTGTTGGAATVQNAAATALVLKGATQAVQMPGLASSSLAQTGTVCWTTGGGNLTVDTTTTCLLSDMRLKKNMVPLNDNEGLTEVMALKPFSYDLKDDPMHVGRQVGLGAQEVAKVDPRLVAIYDRGPNIGTPKGVRYEQLTAVLVKAVQQQQHQIDSLRREIRQLKGRR